VAPVRQPPVRVAPPVKRQKGEPPPLTDSNKPSYVSDLEQCVKELQELLEQEKLRNAKLSASLLPGVHVNVSNDAQRAQWFNLRDAATARKLYDELLPYLTKPGPNSKMTLECRLDALLFLLHYNLSCPRLASGVVPYEGAPIGMPKSTFLGRMKSMLTDLQPWAESQLQLPSVSDWLADSKKTEGDHLPEGIEKFLVASVDGTVLPIFDPTDILAHRKTYNVKHNTTALTYFIVVTPRGRIMHCSKVVSGSTHDATQYAKSGVNALLEAKYGRESRINGRTFGFAICGDKAYANLTVPNGWHLYVTKSGEHDKEGDMPNRHFDGRVAKLRSVVERTIGRMKAMSLLAQDSSFVSMKVSRADQVVKLSAALVNWTINAHNVEQI